MPNFFKQVLVTFVILPLLWTFSNSINVTQSISQATGVNIPSGVEIPGLRKALEIKSTVDTEVDAQKSKATTAARKAAVKQLKKQVKKQYGPEAAALIPADLTLEQAKHYDFKKFEKLLATKGIKTKPAKKPKAPKATKKATPLAKSDYKAALKKLNALPVKGRAPMTGYSRGQFGSEWSDSAGKFKWTNNGCDTRNDVLARDLTNVKRDGKCKVIGGVLTYEVYTGKTNVKFDPKGDYANHFDIEHFVALGNAWVTGAQNISAAKRAALANDPDNLRAVDPSSNRQKGDADFATWLPKNKSFRCEYAAIQVKVKDRYDLWVTKAEKAALSKTLTSCK